MIREILFNMSILISFSVIISVVLHTRFTKRIQEIILGIIFALAVLIAMIYPYQYQPGLFFDGRSIFLSLVSLLFGPIPSLITTLSAIMMRIYQGGIGVITGCLVILYSSLTGLLFHFLYMKKDKKMTLIFFWWFGMIIHIGMLLLMFTLPQSKGIIVIRKIGLFIMIIYPLVTILVGYIIETFKLSKKKSQFLQEQIHFFRMMFDQNQDAILWINQKTGMIVNCNQSALKLFDIDKDDLTGKHYSVFLQGEEYKLALTVSDKQELNASSLNQRFDITTCQGNIKKAEIHSSVIQIEGEYINQCVIRDITDKVITEMNFQKSEQRFREVFELVPLIGILLDAKGFIVSCNEFLLNLTGWEKDDISNKNWFEVFIEEGKDSFIYNEIFLKSVENKQFPKHFVNAIIDKEGRKLLVEWNNLLLFDENGGVEGIASLGINITERKQNEETLMMQRDELQKKNETLQIFNKIATGREMRMIELKKEINNLCEMLAISPRYDLSFTQSKDMKAWGGDDENV